MFNTQPAYHMFPCCSATEFIKQRKANQIIKDLGHFICEMHYAYVYFSQFMPPNKIHIRYTFSNNTIIDFNAKQLQQIVHL